MLSRGVIRPIGWSLMWINQTPKYQFETQPKPCGKPISDRSITSGFWYRISNAWNSIIWRWISFSKFKSNSLKNVTKIFKIGKFQAFKHKIHKSVSISQNVRDWTDDCNESIYIRFTFVVFLLVLSFNRQQFDWSANQNRSFENQADGSRQISNKNIHTITIYWWRFS